LGWHQYVIADVRRLHHWVLTGQRKRI